jgi:iron complex transport system substrate-binding protein
MWHVLACGIVAAVLSAAGLASAADSAPKPKRIVSMNLCTDELVLRLADLRNIASVTWLSRGPTSSNVAQLAAEVSVNHGLAEEIIPLNPDLVIAGIYTTRMTVSLLKRTGIPLLELDVPNSIDGVRRQYLDLAEVLGERAKGERIVAEMDARLAKLPLAPAAGRPRTVVLNPNGFTVGEDTLANEIMRRAGLENVAASLKIDNYHQIPLEMIVTHGVEIVIVSASRDGPPAMAIEILKHPVLAQISDRTRLVVMPTRMWTCGGPAIVDAIELLMKVANEVRGKAGRE